MTVIPTGNNNEPSIINNDTDHAEEKNKEVCDSSAINSDISPFGPWMLVRKNPRSKGKANSSLNHVNNRSINNGSRYSSLMESTENLVDEAVDDQRESNIESSIATNGKEITFAPKRLQKGRTSAVNKVPPPKQKHASLGPKSIHTSTQLNKETKSPSVTQSPNGLSIEEKNEIKEKEKRSLHTMRNLLKKGFTGFENSTLQIWNSSNEALEAAMARRLKAFGVASSSEPPDNSIVELDGSIMDIDESKSSPSHIGKELTGPENGDASLERQTPHISQ
ncbi:hypothetical protein RIF29_35653 [Crotalaria pallida]|uniref:Uncharacterized protein n=1 Tax=Crotalaria pallida TaxID=3830 RepID=A0AAN9EA71_CROPI